MKSWNVIEMKKNYTLQTFISHKLITIIEPANNLLILSIFNAHVFSIIIF